MQLWLELEQQKNMSKYKTEAFASAAHEFRNPLNGIISSLDLIQDKVGANDTYFQIAKSCANNMLFLVNDILDYAQLEAKAIVLNNEKVNLLNLLNECK